MTTLQAILLTLAGCGDVSAASGGQTVLLDFYGDTCAPCRQMAPVIDQLAARGYAIRKVNVAREPALAAQFGVDGIPCFVMVVDGREVDRVVGSTSASRLEQMLAAADHRRADPGTPTQLAAGRRPDAAGSIPMLQSSAPFSAAAPGRGERTFATPSKADASPARGLAGLDPNAGSDDLEKLQARLVAATVRLRVKDARGQSCGTGTIIDARNGQALILTCGHLFRDSQGKGPIEVDLFGPAPAERVPGELVHYDLDRDLGLVSISTPGSVTVARLAPRGSQVAKGSKVIHVGCNNGDAPTARTGHVTSLNRFAGPPNVEVSGIPVQGRSGGGLFTAEGELIGVCNAAIPTDNEGLYAALGAIQSELDARKLAFVCDQAPGGAVAKSETRAGGLPTMPKTMSPPSDLLRWTEATTQPASEASSAANSPSPVISSAGATPSKMTPQEAAVWEQIQRRKGKGAEVICIIRPKDRPTGGGDVLVVDQASPAFLDKLAEPGGAAVATSPSPGVRSAVPSPDWQPRWLDAGYQGE